MDEHKYVRSQTNPGVVINKDKEALEAYRSRKRMAEMNLKVAGRVDELEDRLSSIESVLNKILERL